MKESSPERSSSGIRIGGIQQDELYQALSHSYRRYVLRRLLEADEPVRVADLATELGAWDSQRAVEDRSGADSEAIEAALVYDHLPMMASSGLLEYDAAERVVTRSDRADEIRTHLRAISLD